MLKGYCYQVLDIFLRGTKPFTVIFYELPALNMTLFFFLIKLQNWPMALLVKQPGEEKKPLLGSTALLRQRLEEEGSFESS